MRLRSKHIARSVCRSGFRLVPLKKQLAALLRPVPLPWSIQHRLRFGGEITVKIDRNHSFDMHASGRIENDLFWRGYGGGWEGMSLRIWSRLAPTAKVIVDVGANVGVYSLAAAALQPSARIVAFEPLERIQQQLLKNVALNAFNIEVESSAVSDRTGWATLHDQPRSSFNRATLEPRAEWSNVREHKVATVRLDEFCRERGLESLDLVKLDIEGHELAALRGMGDLLPRFRPTLLIEILTDEAAEMIWPMLEPMGYEAYRIVENQGLIKSANLCGKVGQDRNHLVCRPGAIPASTMQEFLA